ncbi:ribbon-helix-helix domain-containing protein [Pyrococcus kukulkanii]|uniref:Transcriptional regulator n=1 Tax=Pyrococcus kukulkanii TaxID=1609559 RepID=A0A127B8P7_9EURY|nr:type II toxin-antitoxin system ParD family antitoxin [Pyrococcus kukulkanii]AMM53615.1 transcriptional regulator [Pyrococcus kukulkanii]RLF91112.1 MAG: ribbon-helix-helix protein, CopG family [Thermococci archaeon]
MAKMKIISVQLPQSMIHGLDALVKRGVFPNRSEAIRVAIRELLKKELYREELQEELPEYLVR